MVKLKIDENLPKEVVKIFSHEGMDAQTVLDQELKGCTDQILFKTCQKENRTLVTLDLDFADITLYPPGTHQGIIVLRVKNQSKNKMPLIMQTVVKMIKKENLIGKLWIVEEKRVRIHESIDH